MATIGPSNINRNIPQNPQVNANQNVQRQRALDADISKAKTTNVSTLGRQANRTSEDDKTVKTPEEKVTLSFSQEKTESALGTESKKSSPTESATRSESTSKASSGEKSVEDYKMDFINSYADTLSEDEAKEIGGKVAESMLAMGGDLDSGQHEKLLAAHTYNHAKQVINEKMPGASQKEVREAAKSDPELAKAVGLLDASTSFIKAAQKEESVAAGGVSPGGSAAAGTSAASSAGADEGLGVDPFQAHRAAGESFSPGAGDNPASPYHLSPKEQVQMMADNHSAMQEIATIYAQIHADMRKAAAERMALMQETFNAISEIYMGTYASRVRTQDKHFDLMLKMITGNWR